MSPLDLLDLRGRWGPWDRAELQYRALPFEVPAGVTALRVELDYDPTGGGVLDLGCEGPAGYVGWSGGARAHYVVSEAWSTPGYLPTPVTPGQWNVLLGLHRVPERGVEFRLHVTQVSADTVAAERDSLPAAPPVPARPPRRELPGVDGMSWLAADFHAHTLHSDGALSTEQLAALAVSRGLDVLAVTDHNTTSHHGELPCVGERYGIHLLPGQEVTTDLGHANAFGDIGLVDFRRPAALWQRDVAARGGVLSVNHPLGGDVSWQHPLAEPTGVAEVWHSSWHCVPLLRTWGGPLAWWLAWSRGTVPIGGSDFHAEGADALPGSPTTWLLCDGDDALGAVRAGRTAVSVDPSGPVLLRVGDELLALGADGTFLSGFDAGRRRIRGDRVSLGAGAGPRWLEDGDKRVLALCG